MKYNDTHTEFLSHIENHEKKIQKLKQKYNQLVRNLNYTNSLPLAASKTFESFDRLVEVLGVSEETSTKLKRFNANTVGEALILALQYEGRDVPKKNAADQVLQFLAQNDLSVDKQQLLKYIDEYYMKELKRILQESASEIN